MQGVWRHPMRVTGRLAAFVGITGTGIVEHLIRLRLRGRADDARECAEWVHRWGRRTLSGVGIRCSWEGTPPTYGMAVSNHLGYLDIPLLATPRPMVFVSKAEVRWWPYVGSLARCAGTLFVKREARGHVAEVVERIAPVVEGGTVVTIFPEGTSSGGETVLPFRSSLLASAARCGWPVTPVWIGYEVEDGVVSEDVAYWRDMTFAPHFLKLLSRRRIVGRVVYGEAVSGIRDRKELARRLHAEVCALGARHVSATRASGTCAAAPI